MSTEPTYAAPALDKGLDILELLADRPGGLAQSEIAEAAGRSVGQIFRVLATLERRGYIVRDKQSGLYVLSMRLFDLAHRQEPLRGLIAAASPGMRDLAERVRQSCNLSVLDAGRVRVIAQVESPADFGYRVRVGALFGVDTTATGSALTSGEPVVRPDAAQEGITDVVAPVHGASGVVAALTVPYVATTFSAVPAEDVIAAAMACASDISRNLGWSTPVD
ncbi:DNA-binding IclR family transcriptional regulator [Microbacteriaceae bacterium SG_E_30_P1]|uniref:DNA-binding IclR family transcriptional regulator n=1 Tax=Antiquaquibacter oligotrophicus TaxID=2880260 RepID=A0ABT6KP28_9MICO|nr:IclR family transcriptional regulator [Antiquaquibacter oligotrophicus]MDH6181755.1 DNA-binding IclR family transcriptional regulator [Antiquaquibacter oligotrophicus]UDF12564.1 IclR family transcriptional regulator [Antiquaquibacter oligotrophicus]